MCVVDSYSRSWCYMIIEIAARRASIPRVVCVIHLFWTHITLRRVVDGRSACFGLRAHTLYIALCRVVSVWKTDFVKCPRDQYFFCVTLYKFSVPPINHSFVFIIRKSLIIAESHLHFRQTTNIFVWIINKPVLIRRRLIRASKQNPHTYMDTSTCVAPSS